MATLSSHLLNAADGTHASGVKVIINQINSFGDSTKKMTLKTVIGFLNDSKKSNFSL